MKSFHNIIQIIVLGLLLFACKDPYLDKPYTDEIQNFPAATYMENDSILNVKQWVKLLKHAEMFNSMNLQATYTCFVPGDSALNAWLTGKGYAKVEDIPLETAKLLVRYHTVKGTKYSAVDFNDGLIPDSTASGDYLRTSFTENGGLVKINEEAIIVKTKQVTNAYIHVINQVLTPVITTVWEELQSPSYSIMKEAFSLAGFENKLKTVLTSEINSSGATIYRKYRYTLFSISDSVFKSFNINSVAVLIDSLKAGNDYTVATNKLNQFLAYHLLNQQYSFVELSAFADTDNTRSKNYNTLASNQLINISEKSKKIFINWNKNTSKGVEFVKTNKNCKNGVIHEINDLMKVTIPSPSKVRWELTDFPELSFISFYRKAAGSSTQSKSITTADVSSYKWLSVPESKNGLTYELPNKNESVKIKALNGDYLILSLGIFGWVEMQTPAIIAGKYAVYCEHYNPKATEAGGKLLFIVDGKYVGSQISTIGASKTTDQYLTNTKIGEITFTETSQHKLRILAGDNLNTWLDCITFTPM